MTLSEQQSCWRLCRGQLSSRHLLTHEVYDATCCQWHILQVVPSNALQRTLQKKLSSSLNVPWIWISWSHGWQFLSWKSTLLWFGLSFNKCLLRMLSSFWQHIQQVNSSTGLMCSDTTLQAKGHLHSGASSCPQKWLAKSSASKYPQPSVTCITFHPSIQGHFVEGPFWCQTVFLHHRKVLVTWG